MTKKKESEKRRSLSGKIGQEQASKKFFNPRVRAEIWDMDYLNTLPMAELDYMKKFMSEYANASIQTKKDPLIKEYARVNGIGYKRAKKEMLGGGYVLSEQEGSPKKGHLHNKKEHPKDLFDSNNARNNDVFGVTKINSLLEYDLNGMAMKQDIWHETDPHATEDALIEMIDFKNDPEGTLERRKKKS